MNLSAVNEWIAGHATRAMMTMWCVYAFFALAVVPAFFPAAENIVQYISQSVIQLVALPLIMVGGSVLSRAQESRASQDHEALMEVLADVRNLVNATHAAVVNG